MAAQSKIEWTQNTWNPVTGCSKISTGCKNCYAERMSKRLQAMGLPRYQNGFNVTLQEDLIELPYKWKQPRLIFVNSMSDLFHEKVSTDFIQWIFNTMVHCPQHIFQILTKRSERLKELMFSLPWPPNVWVGVSVEDDSVLHRVYDLQQVPAQVRFLSCEPLIGSINCLPLENINWVIVGGESGPGSRSMEKSWVDSIKQQCEINNVAFFFKQWGGVNKKKNGRILEGKTWDEMPTVSVFPLV